MVASASHQRHRMVPLAGICTPVRPHSRRLQSMRMYEKLLQSDVKPHNFVLDRTAHVRLIDFGSAAPLVPNSRLVPPEYCRVPCGTCDYISPEILQAHESALVAMEMSGDEADDGEMNMGEGGYGVETDWWSTGAMIYEMAYGVAPFFARDIRATYLKIIDFSTSLTFQMDVSVSTELRDLLIQYVGMNPYSLGPA
jgi:serine/threonine protein kinase